MARNLEERNEFKESETMKKLMDLLPCKCPLCGDLYKGNEVHECEPVRWQIPHGWGSL